MPGVNRVLYNLDQRGETTPEERTTARRNIDAISADEVAVLFDDHYKVKQSPINMTFAANAVLRRLYQNANGEIGAECNYIYNATQDTAGLMSPYDKAKLDGIAYGAEMNVQSDWNVNDESSDAFIRNKPNLNLFVTHDELGARLDTKQDKLTPGRNITIDANNVISATADPQVQADWAQNDSSAVDYIKNKPANLVQDADYVHTDNNFTDADKDKLLEIEPGAEVNVQADWAQTDSSADDYIKNKPANLVQDPDYVHTDNNFTDGDKSKLGGIESGAEANVQSDWNEADSTQDDYIKNKPDLSVYATKTEVASDLADKQDKLTPGNNITITNNVISATADPQVQADWAQSDSSAVDFIRNKPANLVQDADYVHTDNNFTDSDKTKLDGVESGAEANVQADWDQSNSSADDYIKNKPQNLVQDASYVHTDNNFTDADKTKLSGIEAGAEANVQADWSQSDSTADDYIKNKPDLSVYATKQEVTDGLDGKQDTLTAGSNITITNNVISADAAPQEQADWAQSDSSAVDYIKNKPQNLVQDADYHHTDNNFTTAEKNKLSGIEAGAEANVQADWTEADSTADSFIKNKPNLATVATTGSYNDLTDKPSIPSVPVQGVEVDGTSVVNAQGVAEIDLTPYAKSADLASVATSGSYNDLTDKPSIPAAQVNSDWNAVSGVAQILNKPNLAAVATSGDYDDLSNKPTIPVLPTIIPLVAGTNITLDRQNASLIISSTGGASVQWEQVTQGATNTYTADSLKIHQDFHTVTMHDATNGDVNLGYVVPNLPSAPATDKFLMMGSGSNTPTWSDAPEGHTVGFITVA